MDRSLINHIMNKIVSGELSPGEKLPSENELSLRYQLPRITVRKNLNYLEEMGYLATAQGKGRFVQSRKKQLRLDLSGEKSFTDKMKEEGLNLESIQVFLEAVPYTEKLYDLLGLQPEEALYKTGRLRIVEGDPVALHISYIPASLFPGLLDELNHFSSLFGYFRSKGFDRFSSTKATLSVTFPTEEEQDLLYCPPLVPLLLVETDTLEGEKGQRLQASKILYRSDIFQYNL
jgi:GntR family transcriptional regulator